MTLLHQAAQKAVEVLKLAHHGMIPGLALDKRTAAAIAQLESALQHQEEPSTAVIPPAPPECETEDEKTAFSFGYWQGLHAARKGQEVPREPVALTQESLADIVRAHLGDVYICTRVWNAWNVGTMGQDDFEPADESSLAEDIADAVLAACPSTTRHQEVGSGPDWKEYALHYEKALRHIAETAFASKDWKYAREALAAAPSTPEKAGGESEPARGNTICNPHPDAPHGFNRNASHSAGRYVCECEGWMPPMSSPIPHPLPAQANDGGEHG